MSKKKRKHITPSSLGLALLALAGGAGAQTNVTLFGLLDLNVSQYKGGSKAGGASLTAMNDGTTNGLNGSRWGVRVVEDLGDGLKAGVLMESGVIADNGTLGQGGRSFGRQIYVSMSHNKVGELRLGRQYILSDSVVGQGNPFGNALVNNPTTSVTNMGRNLPMWLNAPRADNTVQYETPTMAGFTAAGQVAPGEGTADRFHGLRAVYRAGAFYTGLTYEWNRSRSSGDDTNKSLSFTANYNFGSFKLLGGLQRNTELTTTSGNGAAVGVSNLILTGPGGSFLVKQIDGYTVGTEIPLNAQVILGGNYTAMKYESASGADASLGKVALSARYGFSKNTFAYVGASLATGDLKEYISQKRVLQAGLRTAF
jgi:GBP family porin